MKFIHLTGLKIGSPLESGVPWSTEREEERFQTLARCLSCAEEKGASLVLISGDLFSHTPVTAELRKVDAIFLEHPELTVVIIAGERDRIRKSSPVRSFVWSPQVHYVLEGEVQRVVLPALFTEIYAASLMDGEEAPARAYLLKNLQAAMDARPLHILDEKPGYVPDRQPIRIALLPGGEAEAVRDAFSDSDFAYVGVGNESGERELLSGRAYAPLALEPESMQETGAHGMYFGEILPEENRLHRIEFLPMASVSFIPLKIAVMPETTAAELELQLQRAIAGRGRGNIYRLKLTGQRNPAEDFGLDALRSAYRIAEVTDETEPVYDYQKLFREHSQDMIGYYIGTIVRGGHEMSELERRAMYYGLDALIKTAGGAES